MQKEIQSKAAYTDSENYWHRRRARYVLHTTGPRAMKRFLKQPKNRVDRQTMQYLTMNYFKDAPRLSIKERSSFDVIDYESNSYFTHALWISVSVGPGNACLPTKIQPGFLIASGSMRNADHELNAQKRRCTTVVKMSAD